MPTLSYVNPWLVDYSYSVTPSQTRSQTPGFTRQAQRSHRNRVVADATLLLRGIELPYFEYFVKETLKEGSLKFTGYYADANGLNTGTIRIMDGAYSVDFDGRNGRVSCQLEIFR
jgi:hypothetical protein